MIPESAILFGPLAGGREGRCSPSKRRLRRPNSLTLVVLVLSSSVPPFLHNGDFVRRPSWRGGIVGANALIQVGHQTVVTTEAKGGDWNIHHHQTEGGSQPNVNLVEM